MDNWRIRIIDKGYKLAMEVYVFRKLPSGRVELIDGTVVEQNTEQKPAFELDPEQMQALVDELSRVGYKPLKGFVEGKLEATEKHLEDMRSLVFSKNKE